jgi:hypothetical protein
VSYGPRWRPVARHRKTGSHAGTVIRQPISCYLNKSHVSPGVFKAAPTLRSKPGRQLAVAYSRAQTRIQFFEKFGTFLSSGAKSQIGGAISQDARVTCSLDVIRGWGTHFPNLGALSCAADDARKPSAALSRVLMRIKSVDCNGERTMNDGRRSRILQLTSQIVSLRRDLDAIKPRRRKASASRRTFAPWSSARI